MKTGDIGQATRDEQIAALMQKGVEASRSGQRARARRYFAAVLEADPAHVEAWLERAAVVDDPQSAVAHVVLALELDPGNASVYRKNLQSFVKRLNDEIVKWQERLAPLRGTAVVVYHESWDYFLEWTGFVQVGALEPKPGIPPKPSHVAELIDRVRGKKVKYLVQESFYPTRLSRVFAQKSGATLKVLPTMVGAGGTRSYIDVIDKLVKELIK